jgi:iron complex outermembrane receptor protein
LPAAEEAPDEEPEKPEEPGDEDVYETVVSATRMETEWKKAPTMVTVIGGEEIEKVPQQTVDDLLKRVPSISFSREHVAECGPGRDVTLLGIHEQKRTLVLVDGIPVNDGINGSVNWSLVPVESVERIELVLGPMSALYGSGAMGGVVNIVTKKPEDANDTLIKAGYGNLDTTTATLLQGGMFEKGGYLVGANLFKTEGYVQAKEDQEYFTKNARTDMGLMGHFYVFPDLYSSLSLRINLVNEDFSRGIRTDEQNNAVALMSLTYELSTASGAHLTAAAYAQLMKREVDLGARPDYSELEHTEFDDSLKVGVMFSTDFEVAGFNTISVGADASFSLMDKHNEYFLVEREASAEGNQLFASLFAQDEMEFDIDEHEVLLTPGVRLDFSRSGDGRSEDTNPAPNPPVDEVYQDRSWVAVNPKLALVYRFRDSTTLRASVGRSFAAPTLFELYTVFTRGPLLLYGNPELDPESAWTGQIGLDQWFTEGFYGRVNVSYSRGTDFIGSRIVDGDPMQLMMDNITEVQILGVDCVLDYTISSMWSLYGGYTFTWSTVVEDVTDESLEGNELPFSPMHRARLGIVFQYLEWIAADLSVRYEGERYTAFENTEESLLGDHFSLNLGLSGRVVDQVSWSLSFENMLDQEYDIYSVPPVPAAAPGFLVHGSVALEF